MLRFLLSASHFFEGLDNELLPNMKVGIIFDLESDANLIWQAGADCRLVVTKMQLFVPRIVFIAEGNKMCMERYMKLHKWNYLREEIYSSNSSRQNTGTFKITSAIERPTDVFVRVWILNDARKASQTGNPFLFDTFNVVNNRTLKSCQLEVGNGINIQKMNMRRQQKWQEFSEMCINIHTPKMSIRVAVPC